MRVEYSPGYYPLNLLKIILYVYLGKEGFYKKLGFMRDGGFPKSGAGNRDWSRRRSLISRGFRRRYRKARVVPK
jgi:hypothetical protein